MQFADRVRAADNRVAEGEAAVTVAGRAMPRAGLTAAGDAADLIAILGLEDATWRWDTDRAARIILEKARHAGEFSANDARTWLPPRAEHCIAGAFRALYLTGLTVPAGGTRKSTAPRARGSLIRCYALTVAGERLAAELAPMPGEAAAAA